jgi:hypothetical protein
MKNLLGIFVALIFFLHSASAQNTNPPAPSAVAQWHWSEPGNFLGWKTVRITDPKVANGALQGRTEDFSRLESPPLKIDAGRLIDLEFRIKSTMGGPGLLIFSREGEERSDDRLINFAIVGDNQFHTYHVSLSSHPLWGGTVAQILFYPLLKAGAQIELQSIQFLPKDSGGLIDNGGFELSDVNSGLPQKWSFQNVKATVVAGRDSLQALLLEAKKGQESRLQSGLFEFPTTGPHQLSFDFKDAAKTLPLSCAVTYFDVFRQPIKTENLELETAPSALWKTAKSTFTTPDLAAYGQITFILNPDSPVTIDNVNVKALPLVKPAWEEDWRANWIMPVDAKKLPQAPRYFRREFTVPQISALKAAEIQITADDTARLFVNGHAFPKGANWSDWRNSDIFDIKPYLQTGKNIVGVMNTNPSSAEGILAEISLQYREEETVINTEPELAYFCW